MLRPDQQTETVASNSLIQESLEKILRSPLFENSDRMRRFLTFVVEAALRKEGDKLKETVIGVEVYDRNPGYDSKVEPIVRTEARRLRLKLKQYYEAEGRVERVRISLPSGGYVPQFHILPESPPLRAEIPSPQTAPDPVLALASGRRRGKRLFLGLAASLLVLLSALGALAVSKLRPQPETGPPPPIRSIAVLPLQNLSRDPGQEYIAEGLTDELIASLAQASSLRIISHTSVMQYKSAKMALPEIAKRLNVDSVIEGSVLDSGEHIRVTLQFVDARTDTHLWAHSYDHNRRDLLQMQDKIARDVSRQITEHLDVPAPLTRARASNWEAYDNFLHGTYFLNKHTTEAIQQSLPYFSRAIELDPKYAPAYAERARNHFYEYLFGLRTAAESFALAGKDARAALQIDPSLGSAHAVLGRIANATWDWKTAESELRRAIALDPNNPAIYCWLAPHLEQSKRFDEAIALVRRAVELDPLSITANSSLAHGLYRARRWTESADAFRRVLNLDPDNLNAHSNLALILVRLGKTDEGLAEVAHNEKRVKGQPGALAVLAHVYAKAGKRKRAEEALTELLETSGKISVHPSDVAFVYLGLENKGKALDWLERAYREQDPGLANLNDDPDFDVIRDEPRYRNLVQKMHFPAP